MSFLLTKNSDLLWNFCFEKIFLDFNALLLIKQIKMFNFIFYFKHLDKNNKTHFLLSNFNKLMLD